MSINRQKVNFWTDAFILDRSCRVIKTPTIPAQPTLQAARKAFARSHICNAARELFHSQGYSATTFDQIAKAAGTRRTTLYSHFRDKAEILEQIADDYQDGLCALVSMLDGPIPTRAQIEAWFAAMVEFVETECTPASLVIGLSIGQEIPDAIQRTSDRFPKTLAKHLPAFKKSMDYSADNGRTRAWSLVVLRELTLACLKSARKEPGCDATMAVVTDMFEWFVRQYA